MSEGGGAPAAEPRSIKTRLDLENSPRYWQRQLKQQSATLMTRPPPPTNPLALPSVSLIKRTMTAVGKVSTYTLEYVDSLLCLLGH